MLPRLLAEESLRRVAELQAASTDVRREDRDRLLRGWEWQAMPPDEMPQSKLTPVQVAARLSLLGIGVRTTRR